MLQAPPAASENVYLADALEQNRNELGKFRTEHKQNNLTHKQELWVLSYLTCHNATQACRDAGYKGDETTLQTVGYENLRKPDIVTALAHYESDLQERTAITQDDIARRLLTMADTQDGPLAARVSALMGLARLHGYIVDRSDVKVAVEHSLKPLGSFPLEELRAIAEEGKRSREQLALIDGEAKVVE